MSMKPGASTCPVASITRRASPRLAPMAVMAPFATATSARREAAPVPSRTSAPRISRSCMRLRLRAAAAEGAPRQHAGVLAAVHDDLAVHHDVLDADRKLLRLRP